MNTEIKEIINKEEIMTVQTLSSKISSARKVVKEAATYVDVHTKSNQNPVVYELDGAVRKFTQIKQDIQTKFSAQAKVELVGSDIVVSCPRPSAVQVLMKKYGAVPKRA